MRRVSAVGSLGGAGLALAAVAPAGAAWLVPGVAGVAVLGLGLARGSGRTVSAGALFVLLGVVGASLAGLDPGFVLLGTVGAVLAWDAGTYGLDLTDQLTPEGTGSRAEAVHVGATLAVASATAGLVYAVTVVGDPAPASMAALVIVVGALLLAVGLEPAAAD